MYLVEIKRNADGLIRQHKDHDKWDETKEYMWSEGNFACDCNRHLTFVAGTDESEERSCSTDKYSVRITDSAGITLYQDDDWDGPVNVAGTLVIDHEYKLQPEVEPNVDTGDDRGGSVDRVEPPATGIREEGTSESDRVDQVEDEMGRLAALGELTVTHEPEPVREILLCDPYGKIVWCMACKGMQDTIKFTNETDKDITIAGIDYSDGVNPEPRPIELGAGKLPIVIGPTCSLTLSHMRQLVVNGELISTQ